MKRFDERGAVDVWLILFIVTMLLFVSTLGFGIWAFSSRQDYKNNVDEKIAAAVKVAEKQTSDKKDVEFVEKEKLPLREYKTPSTYGSISINYPKTWSASVSEGTGSIPIDGFFHPNFVPHIATKTAYALRVQVSEQPYETEMRSLESKVKSGKVTVAPYNAPKVGASVLGSIAVGEINPGQKVTMVLFPLRDKTIKISTESEQFVKDFTDSILANLTFVP